MNKLSLVFSLLLGAMCLCRPVSAQVENTQEMIVKNKVKFSRELQCFCDPENGESTGSCTVIYTHYDERGNEVQWDMGRLGTSYKYVFDEANNHIMTLWVEKGNTTQVDTFQYEYDDQDNRTREVYFDELTTTQNTYNAQNQLTQTISERENEDGNIYKETTTFSYTSTGKLSEKISQMELLPITQPTDEGPFSPDRVKHDYSARDLCTRTRYFVGDSLRKTVHFQYDQAGRLVAEVVDEPSRVGKVDDSRYSGHPSQNWRVTAYRYLPTGQIDVKYAHYGDPCMSIDDYFLMKHTYREDGLIRQVDMRSKDRKESLKIGFTYEFFE